MLELDLTAFDYRKNFKKVKKVFKFYCFSEIQFKRDEIKKHDKNDLSF